MRFRNWRLSIKYAKKSEVQLNFITNKDYFLKIVTKSCIIGIKDVFECFMMVLNY